MGPLAGVNLDQAMREMVIAMGESGDEEGSIRQYRSNWNVKVPEPVGKVRCLDVDIKHWAAIFDYATRQKASETTVKNIARTLGVFTGVGGRPRRLHLVGAVRGPPPPPDDRVEGAQEGSHRQGREQEALQALHLPQGGGRREVRSGFRGGLPRVRVAPRHPGLRHGTPHRRGARAAPRLDQHRDLPQGLGSGLQSCACFSGGPASGR